MTGRPVLEVPSAWCACVFAASSWNRIVGLNPMNRMLEPSGAFEVCMLSVCNCFE